MPRSYRAAAPAHRIAVILVTTTFLCLAGPAAAQSPSESATLGSTLTVPALADLPTGGSLYSIFDTVPAEVISDRIDTGGLFTGELARIGSHGSSWTQTLFRVGDADVTNPNGGGTPMLVPPVYAWERVDITTGLMPIDVNAPGMAVSLTPRRPAPTWTGTAEVFGAGPWLLARQEVTVPPAIARQRAWNDGQIFLSGPVIPNRLGIVVAGGWTNSNRFERADPTLLDSHLASVLTHVVFTPNPSDEMRLLGWVEHSSVPYPHRLVFNQPLASESADAAHVQAEWERRTPDNRALAVFASFGRRSQSNDLRPTSVLVVERLNDGPVPELLNPANGSEVSWSLGARMRTAPFILFDRRHNGRFGFTVSGGSASAESMFNGLIGEKVAGVPARIWQYTSPSTPSSWKNTTLAFYGADTVTIHPRFSVDLGLRFEAVQGSADASSSEVSWRNWFPRASLRWELTDYAHIAAIAGFSRYGHRLLLNELAVGDPSAPTANVYRWNASTSNGAPLISGPVVERVGPGTGADGRLSAIDPKVSRPYMDEFVTGFESRPRSDTVIRLVALARRDKQLLGVLDIGAPESAYSKSFLIDPGDDHAAKQLLPVFNRTPATFGADRYLLTNGPEDVATFVGVEFTMQTTLRRLFLMAGATAGRSEGLSGNIGFGPFENDHGVLGDIFIDPNSRTFAKGRVFTERGYTIKTAGVWSLPWDLRLGYAARYQDGQHFARLVIVNGLSQGTEAVRAFRNGQTRFTYTATLDGRVQKGFTVGERRFAVLFDAYNVLNTATEVEEFSITGPVSRLTSAVQPPRAVHLGIRFSF